MTRPTAAEVRDTVPCPVCNRRPHWYGSMIREAECIECPMDEDCPEVPFGHSTGYRPEQEAVDDWNAAVKAFPATPHKDTTDD